MYRTKPCKSKNCTNPTCGFAHSSEEMQFPKCNFGNNCNRFDYGCKFVHPCETIDQYKLRVNYIDPFCDNDSSDEDVDVVISTYDQQTQIQVPPTTHPSHKKLSRIIEFENSRENIPGIITAIIMMRNVNVTKTPA